MNDYKDGFEAGYIFAREQLVERLSDYNRLDPWTIDKICDMIEGNEI